MSVSAALLTLAACLLTTPAAARAPTTCPGSARTPAPAPSGVPWAQQRYAQGSLNALADGHGVVVAVIDSGVDARHPQLAGAVTPGPDQLDGGPSLLDCVGHGTGVAGIIAARPAADTPFRGLAPAATILALRVSEQVEGEDGTPSGRPGTPAGLATAIRTAVTQGAGVINLSLVTHRDDQAVRDAVQFAVSSDVVVVAAAGNTAEQGNPVPYPAAYDGVIGVGAITADGQRAPTSQTGPYVDLVAPGSQIVTTATPAGWTAMNGTSFATPFVSAAAALLRQYRPDLTAAEIATQLTATADGGHAGPGYGAGVLNPLRALTERLDASPRPAAAPLARPRVNPTAAAASAARKRTLTWALAGLTVALLAALLGTALPRARRRGWRPGLRELPPPPAPTPDPAAPAFGDHR